MEVRLKKNSAKEIDRKKRVSIFYRKQKISAYEGDSVAGALLAAGIKAFSRSFKYHRHRGPSCLSGQCARCIMMVDGRPNVRTCQTLVRDGMRVKPQGKAGFDLMAGADKFSWALPTGFYYKAFHKPSWIWPMAMKAIRRSPGSLPAIPELKEKAEFEVVNATPELLVIGGGFSGIEAALVGAKTGIRVVLVEREPFLGGFEAFQKDNGKNQLGDLIKRLKQAENVRVLSSTTATAIYPEGIVVCIEKVSAQEHFFERTYLIRAKTTVIAPGAMSRPQIFSNNDIPGIMLPEAAQRLVHLYGIKPGNRVFVAGGDNYSLSVAQEMAEEGIHVIGVSDFRAKGFHQPWISSLAASNVPFMPGSYVVAARGGRCIKAVQIAKVGSTSPQTFRVDALIASAGRTPRHKLLSVAGANMVYNPYLGMHVPERMPAGYYAAGRVLGLEDREAIMAQGRLAGAHALTGLGIHSDEVAAKAEAALSQAPPVSRVTQPTVQVNKGKAFVCFCHDVTEKDIDTALAEGFDTAETAKRYTTSSMGMCQGGMCQANFLKLLADKRRGELKMQVLTTPRAPSEPMTIGALAAGHHDHPKLSPLHHVQMSSGGIPIRTGPWIRVNHFGEPEEESLAVRNAAGLVDVSTLGKFRVYGPDANKLLNRIYTKGVDELKSNKILYAAMCNEEAVMIDDGIIVKRGDNDYFLTTGTGRAPLVKEWFGRWCREEDWQVWVVSLTDSYAGMNLAGPKAREILDKITDADISNEALPYMHWAKMEVAGVKAVVFRMGFLGELSYEIHVPASLGTYVWETILAKGADEGVRAAGLETQYTCRLEKGHALPGLDIDGNTTLFEAHFGWIWDRTRDDMVGGPMLRLLEKEEHKKTVIGFSLDGRAGNLEGSIIVNGKVHLGHVTSARYSPILNQTIGLALVKPDPNFRENGRVRLSYNSRELYARYVEQPFYDPKGERLRI